MRLQLVYAGLETCFGPAPCWPSTLLAQHLGCWAINKTGIQLSRHFDFKELCSTGRARVCPAHTISNILRYLYGRTHM